MELCKRILELSQAHSPSGSERRAAESIAAQLRESMDEVWTDVMGNVIACRRCGREGAPKLLLDAHMDEIGLIILGFEGGYARFATLGGVDARTLPGRELYLMTEDGPLYGVIACLPPHVLTAAQREETIEVKDLYIDLGLEDGVAQARIPVGTPGVFRGDAEVFNEKYICGKALDDKACVAIILDAVDRLRDKQLNIDLYVQASVQEELGMRGAVPAAYQVEPDYCIAIDVGHGKTPDSPPVNLGEMGGGVSIARGPNMNHALTERLVETAKHAKIPHQFEVCPGVSGTNAWPIQISRGGVATALLSLPLKYMHTPVEVIKIADAQAISDLLCAFIEDWRADHA